MERLDIYDYRGQRTGRTVDRSQEDALAEGEYFLVVHVCVFDHAGRLLIQKRHKADYGLDGCWDLTVAGHVHSGETSQDAASREAQEEMGIDADFAGQPPLMRLRFDHGFDDIYIVNRDIPVASLHLQQTEVQAARYASRKDVLDMIHNKTFLPYLDSFIESLFDMRCSNGFIREDD